MCIRDRTVTNGLERTGVVAEHLPQCRKKFVGGGRAQYRPELSFDFLDQGQTFGVNPCLRLLCFSWPMVIDHSARAELNNGSPAWMPVYPVFLSPIRIRAKAVCSPQLSLHPCLL